MTTKIEQMGFKEKVFDWYIAGFSQRSIAKKLSDAGCSVNYITVHRFFKEFKEELELYRAEEAATSISAAQDWATSSAELLLMLKSTKSVMIKLLAKIDAMLEGKEQFPMQELQAFNQAHKTLISGVKLLEEMNGTIKSSQTIKVDKLNIQVNNAIKELQRGGYALKELNDGR